MAVLAKATIQRLAVLRTLLFWKDGAEGPLRLHKILFFADRKSFGKQHRHFFSFKKWHLGQFSDDIANALNCLQAAGRIHVHFDGPSGRIEAIADKKCKALISKTFRVQFRHWDQALAGAVKEWAYLNNDQIILQAHDDESYTQSAYGMVIVESDLPEFIEFRRLSSRDAEALTDTVDPRLSDLLRSRLRAAAKRPADEEDWRSVYFQEESVAV